MNIKQIVKTITGTVKDIMYVCTTNGNEIAKKGGTIEFVSPTLEQEIHRQKRRYPFLHWCHEQKKMSALHIAEMSDAQVKELKWFYNAEMSRSAMRNMIEQHKENS